MKTNGRRGKTNKRLSSAKKQAKSEAKTKYGHLAHEKKIRQAKKK